MKGFRGKLAFGVVSSVFLVSAGLVMLKSETPNEFFIPIVFVFAFAGGIIFWLVLNIKESKRRREENFRRKMR